MFSRPDIALRRIHSDYGRLSSALGGGGRGVEQAVTTYYLELCDRAGFRPSAARPANTQVTSVNPPLPELNRFFYTAVGGDWYWTDRLGWSYSDWLAYLSAAGVETWVLSVGGVPAGYFELDPRSGDPEVAYFGLLPQFVGRGLGGYLLTAAVERAWQLGRRVWVHTCTLDHPSALAAYQARGFAVYRQEVAHVAVPPAPPGGWPGCGPRAGCPGQGLPSQGYLESCPQRKPRPD